MGVKILSLFDGMACGMIAMQLAGVDVESYDYDKAKTLFGEHGRGVAHFQRATEEEIKLHGIELAGWCVECNKPIEGRWIGMANFCPWCGRVIRWIHKEDEPK